MIEHPHTGEMLCGSREKCFRKWKIPKEKIMLIISDNRSNMVKAIRLLRERAQDDQLMEDQNNEQQEADSEEEDVTGEDLEAKVLESNNVNDELADEAENELSSNLGYAVSMLDDSMPYGRLGCLAHSLQLLIKEAYDGTYKGVLFKARALVAKVRNSSVAMEQVISKCGKTVIGDNTTRWNSTYMIETA
jgi:hypothetical protein